MTWETIGALAGVAMTLLLAILESGRRVRSVLEARIGALDMHLTTLGTTLARTQEQATARAERLSRVDATVAALDARIRAAEMELARLVRTPMKKDAPMAQT